MNELKDKSQRRTAGWLSSAALTGTLRLKLCKSTFSDQVGLSWPSRGLKCVLECSLHFKPTQSLETQPNKSNSLQTSHVNVALSYHASLQPAFIASAIACQHARVVAMVLLAHCLQTHIKNSPHVTIFSLKVDWENISRSSTCFYFM